MDFSTPLLYYKLLFLLFQSFSLYTITSVPAPPEGKSMWKNLFELNCIFHPLTTRQLLSYMYNLKSHIVFFWTLHRSFCEYPVFSFIFFSTFFSLVFIHNIGHAFYLCQRGWKHRIQRYHVNKNTCGLIKYKWKQTNKNKNAYEMICDITKYAVNFVKIEIII